MLNIPTLAAGLVCHFVEAYKTLKRSKNFLQSVYQKTKKKSYEQVLNLLLVLAWALSNFLCFDNGCSPEVNEC